MNAELLGAFMIGVGSLGLLQSLAAMWRASTPREPNPEPGPRVTPQSLMTGGRRGLREERKAILEALRLCRGELKTMRAERVAAGYDCDPSELDLKYAEFMAYTQRLDDVDRDIEEWKE